MKKCMLFVPLLLVCTLTTVLLTGCASKTTWTKADTTDADLLRDTQECEYEVLKYGTLPNTYQTTAVTHYLNEEKHKVKIMENCMKMKGWNALHQ